MPAVKTVNILPFITVLNLPVLILDKDRKLTYFFIFTLLCGASKSFRKALKALTKPFEVPQRSVKIELKLIFILIQLSENTWDVKVKSLRNTFD